MDSVDGQSLTLPPQMDSISASNPGGLCLKGKIRTKEKCPHCKKPFEVDLHPVTKEQILICKDHQTHPHYFYIDARPMGAGKIYKDKRGKPFDSFLAAHRQLEEMRGEVDDRTFDASDWLPSKLKEYKLKYEAEKWIDSLERDKSYAYVTHVRYTMNHYIIPELGEMDVRDIRRRHIEDFYFKLRGKNLALKSIKGILGNLQTFLNRLYEAEIIRRAPKGVIVKVPQKARGWLNREKQAQVLSLIPERHRLIFETLMETAERPSEVCAHKKKDLIDGELCIERAFDKTGKLKETKSGRVIYRGISLGLWQKLTDHSKDKLPEAWLFLDRYGEPYSRNKLYRIWERACKKAGVKISLYAGTRHSRASQKRLEMEKQVAEACRESLGHTDSRVTMEHYARDRREEII
jgi:integrase